jgi:hypothetical protein
MYTFRGSSIHSRQISSNHNIDAFVSSIYSSIYYECDVYIIIEHYYNYHNL